MTGKLAAVVCLTGDVREGGTLESLKSCGMIGETAIALSPKVSPPPGAYTAIKVSSTGETASIVAILKWFEKTDAQQLLWVFPGGPFFSPVGLRRLQNCAEDTAASLVYSDFFDKNSDGCFAYHPLIDYQLGSVRDDFDFGPVMIFNRNSLVGLADDIDKDYNKYIYGGFYDFRLRLAERGPSFVRLPEPTYQQPKPDESSHSKKMFAYVDPKNRDYQKEMEIVATNYLRRIGAWLESPSSAPLKDDAPYQLKASVIIPVKNRVRTVRDAVTSALSQQASFDYNVIVVDNFSSDGSTQVLSDIARTEKRLVHLVPSRKDLGIGGCWNEAVFAKSCGRIAVQLDSDDIYSGPNVLERIVAEFDGNPYAMVIGSYTTVDFNLEPLPPGLVDHKEWTPQNGHNNALRVSGFGAPRAFHVPTLRAIGVPNVSYGEDYAVALRLCRTYKVGRIFDSLYWCRRWEGNSDSALSLDLSNKYALYKDRIRTVEILARQRMGAG